MEKQNFDRMKKTLSILILIFVVVPLTSMAASAASGSGGHGHGDGGYGGWGGYGGYGPYGFYPPAPYGTSQDSAVICGPYGCLLNEPTAYLPQTILGDNGW